MKPKRKNVQDATLKNIRVLKRRVEKLEFQFQSLIELLAVGIERHRFLNLKTKNRGKR